MAVNTRPTRNVPCVGGTGLALVAAGCLAVPVPVSGPGYAYGPPPPVLVVPPPVYGGFYGGGYYRGGHGYGYRR